jgi:hypothetical protein
VSKWALLFVVLAATTLVMASPSDGSVQTPGVTISGGDLTHPVQLAAVDADAFVRRLVPPPKLDEEPEVFGSGYTITTGYWDEVLRNDRDDREPAEAAAIYFEDGGYVRARQGGEDAWLVLDLRQRAIIDRYLRHARAGLLRERPGILELLTVSSRSESIGIDIGGNQLSATEARELWLGLLVSPRPSFPDPAQRPDGAGPWLVFSLEEGRAVQFLYDPASQTLTDYLGAETYRVIQPVRFTIESATRGGGSSLAIEDDEPRGSRAWWVVMIGAGIVCLGAALWLRQRSSSIKTPE